MVASTDTPDLTPCYVAHKACGCLIAARVDVPEDRRDVARDLADWVRQGWTVERLTVEFVATHRLGCSHVARREAAAQGVLC